MAAVLERNEIGQAIGQMQSSADRAAELAFAAGWFYLVLTAAASSQTTVALPHDLFVRIRFDRLAQQWRRDTDHISSITRTAMHPAYQAIIGMGKPVLPMIFDELKNKGGHWFWALRAITQEDPAKDYTDFEQAKQAWLAWGQSQGFVR